MDSYLSYIQYHQHSNYKVTEVHELVELTEQVLMRAPHSVSVKVTFETSMSETQASKPLFPKLPILQENHNKGQDELMTVLQRKRTKITISP